MFQDPNTSSANKNTVWNILAQLSEVTKIVSVQNSYVPLLKFTLFGISFDLLYASISIENMKEELITDEVMFNVTDKATVRSLTGCRVTEKLLDLLPNFEALNLSLKFVKEWACWRGVSSNVLGYFGGINWAICMAYTSILYPSASAARLIYRFFHTIRSFPWPQPLYLCKINTHKQVKGLFIWDNADHVDQFLQNLRWTAWMPIITPVYPPMNSAFGITLNTREILLEEFKIAEEICKHILLSQSRLPTQWHQLLVPYPLFDMFENFLVIDLACSQPNTLSKWNGFVQSKLRNLTYHIHPDMVVRLWPKALESFTTEDRNKLTYFIGISMWRKLIHLASLTYIRKKSVSKRINLGEPVERFRVST